MINNMQNFEEKFDVKYIHSFCWVTNFIDVRGNIKHTKIIIYHSQDQENKFHMERNHLKHTYEKKVIRLIGNYNI